MNRNIGEAFGFFLVGEDFSAQFGMKAFKIELGLGCGYLGFHAGKIGGASSKSAWRMRHNTAGTLSGHDSRAADRRQEGGGGARLIAQQSWKAARRHAPAFFAQFFPPSLSTNFPKIAYS